MIDEPILDKKDEMAALEVEVQRLIALGPPKRATNNENTEPTLCDVCGGVEGHLAYDNQTFCRCPAIRRKAMETMSRLDPQNNMTFAAYVPRDQSQRAALAAALRVAENAPGTRRDDSDTTNPVRPQPGPAGLLFLGKPGIGKTHLSMAICRDVLERGGVAGYYNVMSLISRIQDSYSGEGFDSRTTIIEEVASRPVVVLDDLGKEHRSTNVEGIIYELIDTLYRYERTVIICTNLPGQASEASQPGTSFEERYDEAVRSRITGMCETFIVKGEDRRKTQSIKRRPRR